MFKAVVTVDGSGQKTERVINFFHVREIGQLRALDGRLIFNIEFADGAILYGIGQEAYDDVRAWALALR
jgi:hypothetical protein